MTTSGSTDFTRNRDQIIKGAMRLIGVLHSGGTPTSQEIADGSEALNLMVKSWAADGLKLWTKSEATLFLQNAQESYILTATDHCTGSYVETALAVAGATSDGTITVDSDAGISSGDFIGIILDSGSFQWTTVNGAPSSNMITLTDTLTGAAAIGQKVFAYTTRIGRPQRVLDARMHIASNDTPIDVTAYQTYRQTPNKSATGLPNQVMYDPQLTSVKMYVWPTLSSVTNDQNRLSFTYERLLEDFDATNDTPDFPQEWNECLKFNLAVRLAPEFGRDAPREVLAMADRTYQRLMGYDRENASVFFEPEYQ